MSSLYAAAIERLAPGHDPAHIEAWMRLEHPTLDGLGARFAREVAVAVACIDAAGIAESDELARSFGLQPRRTALNNKSAAADSTGDAADEHHVDEELDEDKS